VFIPKADGRQRPLGVTALEDKIVQRATIEVLNAIYETDFLDFSYGFRPGRSQHNALDALYVGLLTKKVSCVLDVDIRGFFDSIDHGWLVKWRRTQAQGDVTVVRFADDIVMGFQHRAEAERFQAELRERFAKFRLELHPEKTRLLEFGPYAVTNRRQRGKGKPETFNFLGFTHICGKKRNGRYTVLRHTIRKRLQAKLSEIKIELRRRMHHPIRDQGAWLRSVVGGHIRYYGVPTNSAALHTFRRQVGWIWKRSLQRRSQRRHLNWQRMFRHIDRWLPPARVCHPYPLKRLGVITCGGSRMR
jgi:hypothetical protein